MASSEAAREAPTLSAYAALGSLCSMHAELVNLYLEVNGDAGAFEAKAVLPKGTVAQSHAPASNGMHTSTPSHAASATEVCLSAQCIRLGCRLASVESA